MECRTHCGACCIAPSIAEPFYGMPAGKLAGVACVHLDEQMRCEIFSDARRPALCDRFQAEPAHCGSDREEALQLLFVLEQATSPGTGLPI